MEEIVEVAVEAGIELVGAAGDSKSKGGCIFISILLVLIITGVTLYFVYK